MTARAFRQPFSLRLTSGALLALWCIIAAFPIFWVTAMSFKIPVEAFSTAPLEVVFGPATRAAGKGLSVMGIIILIASLALIYWLAANRLSRLVVWLGNAISVPLAWVVAALIFAISALCYLLFIMPLIMGGIDAISGPLGTPIIGLTFEHYTAVWVEKSFYRNFLNSMIVTAGVVTISLTVGTLAGYGIARSGSNLAFWLLIMALIFRALPHSVLVTGYLPAFINSAEILEPIFGDAAPTLYGKPWAVIIVLVSINQPFTIWMLNSFFQNIPAELDEAARVDGCSHFQAFRRVIMPVMWPGVITTGLFSFLLAYNDYLVTSLLLDAQNQTMVPAITSFFNRETTTTDQVEAVAAAVSITAPLFVLVMVFQRQIVSGLTAGAVKG